MASEMALSGYGGDDFQGAPEENRPDVLREEIRQLQEDLDFVHMERDDLKEEVGALGKDLKFLERELDEARAAATELMDERDEARAARDRQKADALTQWSEKTELQGELESAEGDIEELRSQLERYDKLDATAYDRGYDAGMDEGYEKGLQEGQVREANRLATRIKELEARNRELELGRPAVNGEESEIDGLRRSLQSQLKVSEVLVRRYNNIQHELTATKEEVDRLEAS